MTGVRRVAGRDALVDGWIGVGLLIAGAFVAGEPPAIDEGAARWAEFLDESRTGVLVGATLTLTAGALLVRPIAVVAIRAHDSIALAGLVAWAMALGLLSLGAVALAVAAWREPSAIPPDVLMTLIDGHHLTTWALSAPATGVAVAAITVTAHRLGAGRWLVGFGGLKVATCVVEMLGIGATRGWNAGGRAALTGAIATVTWLALLLAFLRSDPHSQRP